MDNQHRKIKGYRELTQEDIDLMNKVKKQGIELKQLIEELKHNKNIDEKWVLMGESDLQVGLMKLTRSIAKPDFF